MDLQNLRLAYTKGQRAALKLLLEDPRLPEDAKELVLEHHGYTEAMIAEMEAPQYSSEELEAIAHVEERIREDGAHSVSGCPRYCRAMCQYRKTIKELEAKGWKPTSQ
jgi:hypothetical protein